MNFLVDIKFKPDQYKLFFKELSTIFSSFNASLVNCWFFLPLVLMKTRCLLITDKITQVYFIVIIV